MKQSLGFSKQCDVRQTGRQEPGQKKAEFAAGVPAGRFAVPADLTGMAVFLASFESDYILPQTYNVDGGQWMS